MTLPSAPQGPETPAAISEAPQALLAVPSITPDDVRVLMQSPARAQLDDQLKATFVAQLSPMEVENIELKKQIKTLTEKQQTTLQTSVLESAEYQALQEDNEQLKIKSILQYKDPISQIYDKYKYVRQQKNELGGNFGKNIEYKLRLPRNTLRQGKFDRVIKARGVFDADYQQKVANKTATIYEEVSYNNVKRSMIQWAELNKTDPKIIVLFDELKKTA